MLQSSDFKLTTMIVLIVSFTVMSGLAIEMLLYRNVTTGLIMLASSNVMAVLGFRYVSKLSEEPVQELKVLVDLPAGTDVQVVPLLLNSVDSALFSFLLKKCMRTIDQGQIMLHYKRHGEIYNPQRNVFQIKGALYRATRLTVVYCHPP
jgi:hypothetical protein